MTISTFLRPSALDTTLLDAALAGMYTKYRERHPHLKPVEYVLSHPLPARRHLLHQLLCLDRDFPYSDALLESVEAFLSFEQSQLAPENSIDPDGEEYEIFPHAGRDWQSVSAWKGNMLHIAADDKWAIVNPANPELAGCFVPEHRCLDNQIHTAAGPRLRQECVAEIGKRARKIPPPTGVPIITGAGLLPFGHVIHVAGPALERRREATEDEEAKLGEAYWNCLSLAVKNGVRTIVFPCISTGLFNFPSQQAAHVAVRAVSDWFAEFKKVPMRVIFMLWTDLDIQGYQAAMASTFPNSPEFKVRICDLVPDAGVFDDLGGVIIHAGAGLSADAVKDGRGLDYTSNELFGALYPGVVRSTPLRCLYETIGYEWDDKWGWIFAHIHRVLTWGQTPVYSDLRRLVESLGVEYTIMTSNADGLFAQSGFDRERIFTPQGSYARFQCLAPCSADAYFDSMPWVERALPHLDLHDPRIPADRPDLIPKCERCGGEVFMNVRGGDWFLETPYLEAEKRYKQQVEEILARAEQKGKRVVVLELGSGFNTPSVIRYPSEMLGQRAELVRVNKDHAEIHSQVSGRGYRMGAGAFLRLIMEQRERRERREERE